MNDQLYIYDCLTSKLRVSDGDFMTIGTGQKNTFRIEMKSESAGSFAQRDHVCRFFPHGRLKSYSLNGVRLDKDVIIKPSNLYLFVVSGGCFIAWYGKEKDRPDFSRLDPSVWYVYNKEANAWSEPLPLGELHTLPADMKEGGLATFPGLDHCAFLLSDILTVEEHISQRNVADEGRKPDPAAPRTTFLCPSCWETFEAKAALAIAVHPSLCGDDILGEDAMRRFKPVQYDSNSLPVDACGSSCHEWACPYCRHKLPPFFNQLNQHIFSLVGVPAAGKTYYLASLIHDLELELPREFGIPFRDADPVGNTPLNDMRMRVFTAQTAQEAYIGKTALQGRLYHKVWRSGHMDNMPRPFIYNLSQTGDFHSIVLYDNAGENFEPSRDAAQTIGADHLKVADAILFLFDPTTDPGFRALLKDAEDPQFKYSLHPPGRQALLLTEMEIRLRTGRNLPPAQKAHTPLAVIIGKWDTWNQLLGPEPLLPSVRDGKLRTGNIEANSKRLRDLLFRISPHICINAEAMSDCVSYFAASSFGFSSVEFKDENGQILIGPRSGGLSPFKVTDPVMWALSCLAQDFFPCSRT